MGLMFLIVLRSVSKEIGVPNTVEGVEGLNYTLLGGCLLMLLGPFGFCFLFFKMAGKYLSVFVSVS